MSAGTSYGGRCFEQEADALAAWRGDLAVPKVTSEGHLLQCWSYGTAGASGVPWLQVGCVKLTPTGPVSMAAGDSASQVPFLPGVCETTTFNARTPLDEMLAISRADAVLVAGAIASAWVIGWVIRRAARLGTNRDD